MVKMSTPSAPLNVGRIFVTFMRSPILSSDRTAFKLKIMTKYLVLFIEMELFMKFFFTYSDGGNENACHDHPFDGKFLYKHLGKF